MEQLTLHKEEENKQKGIIVSVVIHMLLLLLCLIPYMTMEDKPEQLSGIIVAFGSPDAGSSDAAPISDNPDPSEKSEPDATASDSEDTKSTVPEKKDDISKPKQAAIPVKDITPISDVSDLAVVEAKKEQAKKDNEAAEAERLKTQAAEKARIEAQKKAEAKKAALDAKKGQFSDLLGSGKGNNNNTGNQGDPNGDPNSSALDQIATGSGRIGGGLSDRGVIFEPEITDNSQKTGKVVIKVCVDKTGNISEAKFTQRGSTTTDKYLVDVATKAAKQYQFTPSEVETQCGKHYYRIQGQIGTFSLFDLIFL